VMHMLSTGIHHCKWRTVLGLANSCLFHGDFHMEFRLPFPLPKRRKGSYSWLSLKQFDRRLGRT
jgi:hypothetical protein